MGDTKLSLEKFNGENFTLWRKRAELVLKGLGLWDLANAPRPTNQGPQLEQWSFNQDKALSIVCLALDYSQYVKVVNATTITEVFNILKVEFKNSTLLNKVHLKSQLGVFQ